MLQRQGPQTLGGETLGVVQLGLGRLLFSTYNLNASSEKGRKVSQRLGYIFLYQWLKQFLKQGDI